jgi:hypothetical protein
VLPTHLSNVCDRFSGRFARCSGSWGGALASCKHASDDHLVNGVKVSFSYESPSLITKNGNLDRQPVHLLKVKTGILQAAFPRCLGDDRPHRHLVFLAKLEEVSYFELKSKDHVNRYLKFCPRRRQTAQCK